MSVSIDDQCPCQQLENILKCIFTQCPCQQMGVLVNGRVNRKCPCQQLKICVIYIDLNIDKSSFILLGKKSKVEQIRKIISETPLMLSEQEMKERTHEKYLGEHIHSEGLAETINFTVQQRYLLTVSAIMEIKTIINDYRIHVPGGLNTGIMLWELAVIPMILNNADTWNDISTVTTNKLESLQNMLIRFLLDSPRSTPIPAFFYLSFQNHSTVD